MERFRTFIRSRSGVVLGVLLLALLARALVPAGFMVAHSDTLTLNITICAETSGELKHAQMVVPVERKAPPGEHPRHDATCAFSDLSKAALGGADPILLALALAFILLLAFAPPVAKPFAHAHYLRPPLRGPPVAI